VDVGAQEVPRPGVEGVVAIVVDDGEEGPEKVESWNRRSTSSMGT
jgi:hypothetical protein